MKKLATSLIAALLLHCGAPSASELQASDAEYALSRGMVSLGEARFRLAEQGAKGCWRYEYKAKPSMLARMFIGDVSERSDFCIDNGVVRSQQFEFKRTDKSEDNFTLNFNWKDRVVRSSVGEMRALDEGMVDRLAMQIAVQNWVIARNGKPGPEEIRLSKVEGDRVRTYRFAITGTETVKTPAGSFETVRVERVGDPKKSTRFWLAPSRDWLAVKVEQSKSGSEQLKMLLAR